MVFNKNLIIILSTIMLAAASISYAGYNSSNRNNDPYNEKFHAHKIVQKLTNSNYEKIQFIEVIARNFGYVNNYELKKEYFRARLMVTQGDIVGSRKLMEKNKKNIEKALITLSEKYKKDANSLLNHCAENMSLLRLNADENPSHESFNKMRRNQKRIKIAYKEYDSAMKAFTNLQFSNSINHYRSAKGHAIRILEDLAEPEKKGKIKDRYKIDIVDNRQEIYKKG